MIRDIPQDLVEMFWPLVSALLSRALAYHPHLSLGGLEAIVMYGAGELSIVLDEGQIVGAFVMESNTYPIQYEKGDGQEYPVKKVGNVLACATKVGAWSKFGDAIESHMEQWCKRHGLSTIHMLGRAGWSRFVKRHGWCTAPALIAWKELA